MKKKTMALVVSIVLAATCLALPYPADAASRTIVVPDDFGSIASAIGNATQGDTIFVRKGTCEEKSLVIDKPLMLIGQDKENTVIRNIDTYNSDTPSIFVPPVVAIEIKANNVDIWNFTITSANWFLPINVSANEVRIVDNILEPKSEGIRVNGNNNIIARNSLSGVGNGFIRCIGSNNTVLENKLTGSASSTFGVVWAEGSSNLVVGNVIADTGSWGFGRIKVYGNETIIAENNLTLSGGIDVERGSSNVVCGNRLFRSGGITVLWGFNNVFYANHIESAGVGTTIGAYQDYRDFERSGPAASNNSLYHNNFINNTEAVLTDWVGYGTNYFDNGEEGNYWSDYTGKDVNGDGIGDTPYLIDSKRQDNYPLMIPFNIDAISIVLPEWAVPVEPQEFILPELFPTVPVAVVASVTIVAATAGLLIYRRKRQRNSAKP